MELSLIQILPNTLYTHILHIRCYALQSVMLDTTCNELRNISLVYIRVKISEVDGDKLKVRKILEESGNVSDSSKAVVPYQYLWRRQTKLCCVSRGRKSKEVHSACEHSHHPSWGSENWERSRHPCAWGRGV